MPGIDDPFDAINKQIPEYPTHPISRILELTLASMVLDAGANVHPVAGMLNAVRNFFSKKDAEARVQALLQVLESYVREHDQRIEELSAKTDSPEFIETLLVAVDHALRTANAEKIKRFALVLGHELLSDSDARSYEDAATQIRNLSELGEADIEVLSIFHAFQADLVSDTPILGAGWQFWGMIHGVTEEVAERGIPLDKFYSRCAKLNGYGLVHQVETGNTYFSTEGDGMSYTLASDAYLITHSGKELIDILGNSAELLVSADEYRKRVLTVSERMKAGFAEDYPPPYRLDTA